MLARQGLNVSISANQAVEILLKLAATAPSDKVLPSDFVQYVVERITRGFFSPDALATLGVILDHCHRYGGSDASKQYQGPDFEFDVDPEDESANFVWRGKDEGIYAFIRFIPNKESGQIVLLDWDAGTSNTYAFFNELGKVLQDALSKDASPAFSAD
jgi:hypothetical protein